MKKNNPYAYALTLFIIGLRIINYDERSHK